MFSLKKKAKATRPDAGPAAAGSARGVVSTEPTGQHFAPGTEIGYHPDLIGRFHGTHAALRQLHASIKDHVERSDFSAAQGRLDAFRKTLTAHLLEENVKLYTYLAKCLETDADNRDIIVSMKSEMGRIGTTVLAFINEFIGSGITSANERDFRERWDGIGAVLVDRIEREESTLYAMYLPPGAFR